MPRPQTLQETVPAFGRVARRFWPHLKSERRLIFISLIALFAEIGLRLLKPGRSSFVSRPGACAGREQFRVGFSDPSFKGRRHTAHDIRNRDRCLHGARAAAAYMNTVGFTTVGNRVLAQVRSQMYSHLQSLSLSYHTKERSGDLVVRVISDVSQLKDVTVTALIPLMAHSLILVGMLMLMFLINW